jgi:hypothetical protein
MAGKGLPKAAIENTIPAFEANPVVGNEYLVTALTEAAEASAVANLA